MKEVIYQLDRIANALEVIAKGISGSSESIIENHPVVFNELKNKNFITNLPLLPEEELFIKTTNIYLDETNRKFTNNLQRKSGKVVSHNLIAMQINFLSNFLPDHEIHEHSSAVLVISKNEVPKALIRIYTDLGFHRANHWQNDIKDIITIASSLNIQKENIFLVVLSNSNGLDNAHVCSTLGFDISNKDIFKLSNHNILSEFCEIYIQSFSNILPYPERQMFFLAGALHPNTTAEDIYSNNNLVIDLQNYNWISTPFSEIFSNIKSI